MKYFAFTIMSMKKSLYYRKSSSLTIFFSCFEIYILSLFWKAIYIDNYKMYKFMLFYSILSQIMSTMYFFNLQLSQNIRSGDLSVELLRPLHYIGVLFFENLGEAFGKIVTVAIPVLIISIIFFEFPTIGIMQLSIWIICIFLSFIILFLIKAITELACFWFVEAWSLGYIVNTLIRLLSGSFLPSFLVTSNLEKAMNNLPFIWIYQKPIELYIKGVGQSTINLSAYYKIWGNQLLWILGLSVCVCVLWTSGRKKIMIQGG